MDALRKPKSHYRETKVRRLIIVTATAGRSSSRRKREMEDAGERRVEEQEGAVVANEAEGRAEGRGGDEGRE